MRDDDLPRIFRLNRIIDNTGVSGRGIVAQGVLSIDGSVALRWLTEHRSWCIYESILEVYAIHGHDGKTKIEFYEEGEWSRWEPPRKWSKTGSTKGPPSPSPSRSRAEKREPKILTDSEILAVERRLTRGPGRLRSKLTTDQRAVELEERMTRLSIVRDAQEATDGAWRSRRFKS